MLTGECKKIHIVPITVVRAFSVQLSAKRCFPNKIRHNDNSNKLLTSESTTKTCLASNFRWYPEISILQHKIIQIFESHTLFNICSISMLSNWWVQLMKIEISVSELLLRPFCLILPSTDTTDVWIASLSESKESKTTVDIFTLGFLRVPSILSASGNVWPPAPVPNYCSKKSEWLLLFSWQLHFWW